MIYEIRGNCIGHWTSVHLGDEPGGEQCLSVRGVRSFGAQHESYLLKYIAPTSAEAEVSELRFALCEPNGDLIVPDLIARPEAWNGLGAGGSHVVFEATGSGAQVILDLDGLPRVPGDRRYCKTRVARGLVDAVEGNGIPTVCFTAGTTILTARGRETVDVLEPGDGIWTLDRGIRPLGWKSTTTVVFDETNADLRPIRFEAESLGRGYPSKTVWLAPEHRVLVKGWKAELFFGLSEVLVPAKALAGWDGIARDDEIAEITYHCLLLDTHEIVNAGGLLCETLLPRDALEGTGSALDRSEIRRTIPILKILNGRLCGPTARPVADSHGTLEYLDRRVA